MGETLPEELGEYSIPSGGSVMSHPGLPDGLEPATSGLCKSSVSTGEGGSSGRREGAQIAWPVLSLTPAPKEGLTGEEKRKIGLR